MLEIPPANQDIKQDMRVVLVMNRPEPTCRMLLWRSGFYGRVVSLKHCGCCRKILKISIVVSRENAPINPEYLRKLEQTSFEAERQQLYFSECARMRTLGDQTTLFWSANRSDLLRSRTMPTLCSFFPWLDVI